MPGRVVADLGDPIRRESRGPIPRRSAVTPKTLEDRTLPTCPSGPGRAIMVPGGPRGPRRHRHAHAARDVTRATPDAHYQGGGDEVGDGRKIHQRKKAPAMPAWGSCSVATGFSLGGPRDS
jgi:hypothetical protein